MSYDDTAERFAKMTESFSVSGESYKGQGGDFIHEVVNKTIESFSHQLVCLQKKDTWRNIIRKCKTLEEMKRSVLASSGYNSEQQKKRPQKFEKEITLVWKQLQIALLPSDKDDNLRSLDGEELDE